MTGFLVGLAPGLYLLLLALLLGWALKRWFDPLPPRILAVFGVVLCLFYGSVLFGGRVLLPVEILTRHPPFAVLRPPKVELANRLQLDLITMVAPSLALVRREIRAGEWPLWNHLAGAGMPLLADPQAQAFQPLVAAAYPLALEVATGVTAALRVLVALVFLFLLLRRQGLSQAPALFGSLAFSLGGFLQLWLGWPIANSAALLPLLLYAVAISDDRGERRDFLLLALALWAVLLSGQPETTVNDLLLAAAFAGARIWTRRRSRVTPQNPHGLRRLLGRWALAAAIAAGAAAPLLLPAADYLPQTHRNARIELRNRQVRKAGSLQGWRTAAEVKDQLRHLELRLLPVAAPNAFGNNRFGLYWGHDFINEDAGAFAGGAALLLGLLAAAPLRSPQRRFREERFFLAVAVVSLVVLVRPPGTMPVLAALPLLGKSATWQHRAVLPLGLAIAWLAACALERWRAEGVRWPPLTAAAAGLAAVVAFAYLGPGRPPAFIPPGTLQTLRWQSLAVNLAALGATALLLAPWRRRGIPAGEGPAHAGWRLALLAVVATAELCWFHQPANPGQPRQLYYPTTPAVAFLEHHLRGPQGFRFAALGPMLPANGAAVYDLADARYLNPLKPWNVALVTRPLLASDLDVNDVFQLQDHPLYKLLGLRYMMTPPGTRMPPPWRLELQDPSAWVYERPDPLPRLFLPGAVEVLPGDAWVAWMKVPRDYAKQAVFRAGPDEGASPTKVILSESEGSGRGEAGIPAVASVGEATLPQILRSRSG